MTTPRARRALDHAAHAAHGVAALRTRPSPQASPRTTRLSRRDMRAVRKLGRVPIEKGVMGAECRKMPLGRLGQLPSFRSCNHAKRPLTADIRLRSRAFGISPERALGCCLMSYTRERASGKWHRAQTIPQTTGTWLRTIFLNLDQAQDQDPRVDRRAPGTSSWVAADLHELLGSSLHLHETSGKGPGRRRARNSTLPCRHLTVNT
ncbi:MAG: hypothetical protein Q9159_000604 [Coniocarpon cinnabarinum]